MRILHTADLHIGKNLDGYPMIEDQKHILNQILEIIKEQKPDAVVLAGDIYDKSVPSAEAVALFDSFLTSITNENVPVFVISGNHDSPERIAFGSDIMNRGGAHLSHVYKADSVTPVTLADEYGEVDFYMVPFIKPFEVRGYFPDDAIGSDYNPMMQSVIDNLHIDYSRRNVLVTHQFVTGAETSDSEERPVGGLDNIDVAVFEKFDYVALGHLHKPQSCGGLDYVRYAGSPLKYSLSEVEGDKSVTMVTIREKGNVTVETIPLKPLHRMVELRDSYERLTSLDFYQNTTYPEDYLYITLTDSVEVPEAMRKLRGIYNRLAGLKYCNVTNNVVTGGNVNVEIDLDKPDELADEFFYEKKGKSMSDEQREYLNTLINQIWGEH